jgi:hypothetical protein
MLIVAKKTPANLLGETAGENSDIFKKLPLTQFQIQCQNIFINLIDNYVVVYL